MSGHRHHKWADISHGVNRSGRAFLETDLWIKLWNAWSADTSADPEGWTLEHPSHGQCAVTALVVQDHFGGKLLRTVNEGVSHYWNQFEDGTQMDFTRDQFENWNPSEIVERKREYVLSFPETADRYKLLVESMQSALTFDPAADLTVPTPPFLESVGDEDDEDDEWYEPEQ